MLQQRSMSTGVRHNTWTHKVPYLIKLNTACLNIRIDIGFLDSISGTTKNLILTSLVADTLPFSQFQIYLKIIQLATSSLNSCNILLWLVLGNHHILGQAIAVKKALERDQKEMIAAGGTARGRGSHHYSLLCLFALKPRCVQATLHGSRFWVCASMSCVHKISQVVELCARN